MFRKKKKSIKADMNFDCQKTIENKIQPISEFLVKLLLSKK